MGKPTQNWELGCEREWKLSTGILQDPKVHSWFSICPLLCPLRFCSSVPSGLLPKKKKKNRQPCPGGLLLVESKASVQRDNDWQGAVPVRPAPQKIAKLSQEQVRRLERPPETKTTLEHFWGVHIPLKVAAQKEQKLISESFSTGLQRKLAYVTSATCTQKALTLTQETSSTPSCSLQDGTNQHEHPSATAAPHCPCTPCALVSPLNYPENPSAGSLNHRPKHVPADSRITCLQEKLQFFFTFLLPWSGLDLLGISEQNSPNPRPSQTASETL